MKRNWDLIRKILIKAEELDHKSTLSLQDFDEEHSEVSYNVKLLEQAFLLEANISPRSGNVERRDFNIFSLTWGGHDFLDSIRNETVWNKTKSKITSIGGGLTFELVKAFAVQSLKELVFPNGSA